MFNLPGSSVLKSGTKKRNWQRKGDSVSGGLILTRCGWIFVKQKIKNLLQTSLKLLSFSSGEKQKFCRCGCKNKDRLLKMEQNQLLNLKTVTGTLTLTLNFDPNLHLDSFKTSLWPWMWPHQVRLFCRHLRETWPNFLRWWCKVTP